MFNKKNLLKHKIKISQKALVKIKKNQLSTLAIQKLKVRIINGKMPRLQEFRQNKIKKMTIFKVNNRLKN